MENVRVISFDCPVVKWQIFLLCSLSFAIENTESWVGQSTTCKEDGPLFFLNNPNPPSRPACFSGIIRQVHCKEDSHKSSQKQTPSGDTKWWYQGDLRLICRQVTAEQGSCGVGLNLEQHSAQIKILPSVVLFNPFFQDQMNAFLIQNFDTFLL